MKIGRSELWIQPPLSVRIALSVQPASLPHGRPDRKGRAAHLSGDATVARGEPARNMRAQVDALHTLRDGASTYLRMLAGSGLGFASCEACPGQSHCH